jgi:hypothetical protein
VNDVTSAQSSVTDFLSGSRTFAAFPKAQELEQIPSIRIGFTCSELLQLRARPESEKTSRGGLFLIDLVPEAEQAIITHYDEQNSSVLLIHIQFF